MHIGVLGNEGSWYVDELCRVGTHLTHQVAPLTFPFLTAASIPSGVEFRFGDRDLRHFDAIIVRTMPPGSLERIVTRMDLLAGLESEGVRVINSPRAIECAVDKWLTTQKLLQAGISVPETAVSEDSKLAIALYEQLGGDVLVKPLFGSEGRGMIRVDSPDLAWRVFRSLERIGAVIYLQRFIAHMHEDYRILLLDGEVIGSMKRTAPSDDFRTNAAQSGVCSAWVPDSAEIKLARRAADATGCVFCGVDLIYDENGQACVLEVNAVPGWKALQTVCDVCVPSRLFQWIAND